ncbi:MAG: hypothetical protein ACRD1B_03385 [Thermoanaerobaculia bacterium]
MLINEIEACCPGCGAWRAQLTAIHDAGTAVTRELESVPAEWPLVGVGAEPYKALAYLYPNRAVLGVPHPTGARGNQWHGLFDGPSLTPAILSAAQNAMSMRAARWLCKGAFA